MSGLKDVCFQSTPGCFLSDDYHSWEPSYEQPADLPTTATAIGLERFYGKRARSSNFDSFLDRYFMCASSYRCEEASSCLDPENLQ